MSYPPGMSFEALVSAGIAHRCSMCRHEITDGPVYNEVIDEEYHKECADIKVQELFEDLDGLASALMRTDWSEKDGCREYMRILGKISYYREQLESLIK